MQTRKLGNSNLEVSAIGRRLHGNELFLWSAQRQTGMTALLGAAVDRGITFFDTAEVYGP